MDTTKVVFLLLSHILVSSGQGKGSKSRFDDILSKFGFGGSPVALEQQTQGPNVAHATKVKTLDVSQPFKKEGVKHDKKKFTDALSKFGFGLPDSSEKKKQKSPEVTKSLKQDIKKYAQLINPSRTDDKNKFKEALKQFGFSSSPTAAFPQGIASSIVLNESLNQPQLVQVVTSTFSPTHQILPRDSKRQTSQIHKTTIPTFTRERHTEIRKYTNKGHTIQDKKIKKHKKSKKNLNNVKKLNYPSKSHATVNDSTFFVTPKSLVHKKHKKKNGKESKIQNTLELKKTNSRQNNSRLHAKPKHLDQSHIELAFSDASFTTGKSILVTPQHIPVDFGEEQLSTQRPRHSRQQDFEDKTNALAALFNVAGGTNKATKEPPKPVRKKKLKVKKPLELNENNILREGLRQTSRGNIPAKAKKADKRRPPNKQSGRTSFITTTRTSFGGKEKARTQNKSNSPPIPNNPLASLFSLIKDEGKQNDIQNYPKENRRGNKQNRQQNVPVLTTQRSQIRPTPERNNISASTRRGNRPPTPRVNQPNSKSNIQVTTSQRSQSKPTPRRNNISASTRRGNRPPNNQDRKSVRNGVKQELGSSISRNLPKEQLRSTKRRTSPRPSIQVKPTGGSRSQQTFPSTQRSTSQTQPTRIKSTSQKSKSKNIGFEISTQRKQQGTGSKSNFDSILSKFGFGGKSTQLEQQKQTQSVSSLNEGFSSQAKKTQSQTTQTSKTNHHNNNIDSSTRPIKEKTERLESILSGISIISKSEGFSPNSKKITDNENNFIPSTTPFTIFRSPSTRAPSQERGTDAPKSQTNKSLTTQRVSVRKSQGSPTSRGFSLGRGRGSSTSNSNVRTSQIARTTQSSRGFGESPSSTTRTVTPRQNVSNRHPSRQNPVPANKLSAGSNVLDNLIQIAGNAANNPVKTAKATTPTLPPNIPDRRVNVPIGRKSVDKNIKPSLNTISNPFIQQTREEPVQATNIRINSNSRGRTSSRQPVQGSKNEDNLEERNRSRFQAEQDRVRPSTSGRVSGPDLGRDATLLRNIVENVQPKRNQLPPRRPSIIIEDPEFNSVDDYDDRDDDRRSSIAIRQREKSEERRRPTKSKHKSSSNISKVRPPVSAGCFHICDTLIFEVYKLLGGGLCDC